MLSFFNYCENNICARGPQVKNAGRDDLFNLLTRISPQPARASFGAGWADPQTRKKKILTLNSSRAT